MRSKWMLGWIVFLMAQPSYAARTYVPMPDKKIDKASEKVKGMTKNVKVSSLVQAAQPLFSVSNYEAQLKKLSQNKKAKSLKIDKIMHGESLFYVREGQLKIVFRWVDKNNVAFTLNGHEFSYEEAANPNLWQPKVHEVIKSTAQNLDSGRTSSLLNLLFARKAYAFGENLTLSNPWILGGLGIAVTALIVNTFYQKHKKESQAKCDAVDGKIAEAEENLENKRNAAEEQGRPFTTGDEAPYLRQIDKYTNLRKTCQDQVNNVGFWSYLMGGRFTKPALYDSQMGTE